MTDKTLDLSKLNINKSAPAIPGAELPPKEFQQYTCQRISTSFITPTGKKLNFTNYEYYTKDPECMAYLDEIIAGGRCGVTKGELLSVDDLNPAAALKRKHIEEFLASQEGRDFTAANADPAEVAKKAGIASTDAVAF